MRSESASPIRSAKGVVPSAPSNVKTSSTPAASAAGSARSSIGPIGDQEPRTGGAKLIA